MTYNQKASLSELIEQFERQRQTLFDFVRQDDGNPKPEITADIAITEREVEKLLAAILGHVPSDFGELILKAAFIIEEVADGTDMNQHHRDMLDLVIKDIKALS